MPLLDPLNEYKFNRRYLPHYQIAERYYFITSHCKKGITLTSPERDIIHQAILFLDGKKYDLTTSVVMDDHIHIVLKPLQTDSENYYSISQIMHSIKSFSAQKCGRKLWQHESYDRVVRNGEDFLEYLQYIRNNPYKRELVQADEDYKWYYLVNVTE